MSNESSVKKVITETASIDNSVVILNTHITACSESRSINLEKDLKVVVNMSGRKLVMVKLFRDGFMKKYLKLWRDADAEINRLGGRCELGHVHRKKTAIDTLSKLKRFGVMWDQFKVSDAVSYANDCIQVAEAARKEAIEAGADDGQARNLHEAIIFNQPSWKQLDKQLQFGYSLIQLSLDVDDFDADLYEDQANGLMLIRNSVMGNLINEISKMAADIEKTILTKEAKEERLKPLCINNRTITRVRDMIAKLDELSFIHPHIKTVRDELSIKFSALPSGEALRHHDYRNFKALISCLSDQVELTTKLEASEPLIEVVLEKPGQTQSSLLQEAEDIAVGIISVVEDETESPSDEVESIANVEIPKRTGISLF